jgi:hemoglobin
MTTAAKVSEPSLYDRAGGMPGIERLTNRFYDLMETEPAYAALRAMHAPSLDPMRQSLALFLAAWLGGPRDWFEQQPARARCIMSMHRALDIGRDTAGQWLHAMSRAMVETGVDPDLGQQIQSALARMAGGMIRAPECPQPKP